MESLWLLYSICINKNTYISYFLCVQSTLFEQEYLHLCLSFLPENLRSIAEQQISEYNLFQPEAK